jgi:hypothetical protein
MGYYLLIRFNGCLNGEKEKVINLLLLKFETTGYLSISDLIDYLYKKRGKGELGHKNGPGTAGWLEVTRINNSKPSWFYNDCKVVTVNSFELEEIYEQIKNDLKVAINEKIKIQKKKTVLNFKEKKSKKRKKRGVERSVI